MAMRRDGPLPEFGHSEARKSFEARWTEKNYDALTDILDNLPTDWRFFIKHRVFEALDELPDAELDHEGRQVRAIFKRVAAEFPELTPYAGNNGEPS